MNERMTVAAPGPSRRRLAAAMLALFVLATSAAAAGILGRASYGGQVSADEPYYLLAALAFATDGTLDISDELADEDWRGFHDKRLPEQTKPLDGGRRVAPHDPLLPIVLSPAMWWGTRLGGTGMGATAAKAELALIAGALAALLVWTAVRRFGVSLRTASVVVGGFMLSAPLAAYGHQLYPEVPLALCATIAVAALTGPFGLGGALTLLVAVVAMPWLAVKSLPVAGVLGLVGLVRLARRRAWAAVALLVLAGAAAGVGYLLLSRELYGGWTPYAAGDHFVRGEFTAIGTRVDLLGRSRRLVGLLVDRGFGIAAWQPAWLLLVPPLAATLRRRPAHWPVLVLPLAAGYLNATFVAFTMQGWWFPGRQLVIVLPLAVLLIALWADRLGRRAFALIAGLMALGVWSYAWLAGQAAGKRLTWIVDFFLTKDPWYRMWSPVLPNYVRVTDSTWVLHAEWIVVLTALAWAGWRAAGPSRAHRGPRAARAPAFLESDREDSPT
jgi:hypothetical protein